MSSAWSVGWDTYLASMRDFIVCSVDVRGSGYQGDDIKHSVSYQVTDTLHVIRYIITLGYSIIYTVIIRYLAESLSYVDSSKICVWGWSYGGYLTGTVR